MHEFGCECLTTEIKSKYNCYNYILRTFLTLVVSDFVIVCFHGGKGLYSLWTPAA